MWEILRCGSVSVGPCLKVAAILLSRQMPYRIKVVVISLKDYPDRLMKMEPMLKQLQMIGLESEILYGVNGRNIDIQDTSIPQIKRLTYEGNHLMYNRAVRVNGQPMTRGEFGCAWSHYNVYQKLVDDRDADAYLVLEDDAEMICPLEKVQEVLQNIPQDFDILRTTPSQWYPFAKTESINPYFYAYKKQYTNHTTSYIISKLGALKMISYLGGFLNVPSDDAYSNLYIYNDNVKSYASEPLLFRDPETQPSHIHSIVDKNLPSVI